MALLLINASATVTVVPLEDARTWAPSRARADILVAAVGKARMIRATMVKPGAVVIDVGINRLPDGKLAGDVDYDAVAAVASHITPVPGGVGPMTIAMLLANDGRAPSASPASHEPRDEDRLTGPYATGLDRNAANYTPLTPVSFLPKAAVHVSQAAGDHPRQGAPRLERDLWALPAARLRARPRRDRPRRHGGRDAAQRAGDGRAALRPGDDRCRAEHAQHAPGRRGARVHARPRRGEGGV
jgi:hypothetical protein